MISLDSTGKLSIGWSHHMQSPTLPEAIKQKKLLVYGTVSSKRRVLDKKNDSIVNEPQIDRIVEVDATSEELDCMNSRFLEL